jgi:hypothetical protein
MLKSVNWLAGVEHLLQSRFPLEIKMLTSFPNKARVLDYTRPVLSGFALLGYNTRYIIDFVKEVVV